MNPKRLKSILTLGFSILFFFVNAQGHFLKNYPDSINKKRLYSIIVAESGGYLTGISFLSFIWYKDHERVPFHWYNDSEGYLQMDKGGHAFGAYRYSVSAYHALRWAGVDKKRALIFGGPIGLVFQTPVEIFDGMYEGWGFSWPDMAANTFGSALFIVQEAYFDQQLVLMKFSYSPSEYPKYHTHLGETPVEQFFYDYNGHTYWFSANLQGITGNKKIPAWLNLAVGYSANGMIYEFDNPEYYQGKPFPKLDRYRQYVLSLDIDFTKIKTKKRWLKKLFGTINLLKFPFPALEWNRVHGLQAHPIYY